MAVITRKLTTSAAGAVTKTLHIHGLIDTLSVNYDALADAGTDLTITGYLGSQSFTLYSNTDTNTDFIVRPRVSTQDNTGTDLTYDGTEKVSTKYMVDMIVITFAQGGASITNSVAIGYNKVY